MAGARDQMEPARNSDPDDETAAIKARAERLKIAVRQAGGNSHIATIAGMHVGTLNNYIAGRDMKASAMIALAKACRVSLDWLAEGVGSMESEGDAAAFPAHQAFVAANQNVVDVRYYDVRASAGFGLLNDEKPKPIIIQIFKAILDKVNVHPNDAIIIHANGDSMVPTINSDDALVVDTRRSSSLSGVYVMVLNGQLLVKRLSLRADGSIRISSDNTIYPPDEVPLENVCWGEAERSDQLCIVGKVKMLFHEMP
ncbi:MAG: S24 family peptidase [Gluconacetobacter sp.]